MSDNPLAGVAAPDSLDAHVAARTAAWLSVATDAASPDTQLLARLIAARDARSELALLGLHQPAWRALLARHFTRASAVALPLPINAIDQIDFVRTLHTLLRAHTNESVDPADADCLATIIAHACLRPDHLWRDLGLRGRDDVTWMLTRYFPTLVERNVANLRWKKFLAEQRALSLGLTPGPAPGCPGCEDYGHCFPNLG
ncbi:nitrogen fixation protein NifQ [Paraburkholderia sp. BCC1876]|uniref:nitrogen fixation protein NifQ n=1 Tax=Paraburkholderia sp. BCC1876 TaxID=2676303 RepID=UPI001591858C|nr:nitrogen fixation protein NifQ [Paraburkholderia sp. BCC1876]